MPIGAHNGEPDGGVRTAALAKRAAVTLLLLSLAGCTTGQTHCSGAAPRLSPLGGEAETASGPDPRATALLDERPLAELRCWAEAGNAVAQYALGYAYETGDGVTADAKRARRYYKAAAADRPGRTYVYSPPVGKETYGRVIPVATGDARPGLPEARAALARLQDAAKQQVGDKGPE